MLWSVWSAFILLTYANILWATFHDYKGKRSVKDDLRPKAIDGGPHDKVPESSLSLEVEVYNEDTLTGPIKSRRKPTVVKMRPSFVEPPSWGERALKRSTRDVTSNDQNLRTDPPRSRHCPIDCEARGRCIPRNTYNGGEYQCLCKFGYVGLKCDKKVSIKYPKFENVGSFITLKPGTSSTEKLSIVIELRASTSAGLILYTNSKASGFFSLTLTNRKLEFRFVVGNQISSLTTVDELKKERWYKIKLEKNNRQAKIIVNDLVWNSTPRIIRTSNFPVFTESNKLYLGGHPYHTTKLIQSRLIDLAGNGAEVGLIGCVKRLSINGRDFDLRQGPFVGDIIGGAGIKDCTNYNKCSREKCGRNGRCKMTGPDTPQCLCPKGTKGKFCEQGEELKMPQFIGNSFLKYSFLKHTSRSQTNLEIIFKPYRSTGLLLYSGYSRDKRGDFLAIIIRKGICEVVFDLGSGFAKIKSLHPISMNQWHRVYFKRIGRLGLLTVDNQPTLEADTPGNSVQLTLREDLYLGYHENFDYVSYSMTMRKGFRGCIQKLTVNGKLIRLINDAKESVNVVNCQDHQCSKRMNPCTENGDCIPLMDDYSCSCRLPHVGSNCEISISPKNIRMMSFSGQSYLKYDRPDILRNVSKPQFTLTIKLNLKRRKNRGVLMFLGGNMEGYSRYILLKVVDNYLEVHINDGYAEPVKMNKIGKILGNRDYKITLKREPNKSAKKDQYSILFDNTRVMTANQPLHDMAKLKQYSQILIGGVDRETAARLNLAANSGITGCIQEVILKTIEMSSFSLNATNAVDGRSINECKKHGKSKYFR